MNCQYCGSQLKLGVDKCPNCGGVQGADASIPPPSPYYVSVIPTTPLVVETPETPVPPKPVTPITPMPTFEVPPSVKFDKSTMALIALILGLVGIPLALMTAGCSTILNLVGIVLAWLGRKSSRRGMAIAGLVLNIGTIVAVVVFWVIMAGLFTSSILNSN